MSRRHIALGVAALAVIAAGAVVLVMPGSGGPATVTPRAPRLTAGGPHNAPSGARTLTAGSFTASYPPSWSASSARASKARSYRLSSTGARIGSVGIGPAGTVGVTIYEIGLPRALVASSGKGSSASADGLELLRRVVGVPRGAHGVTRTEAPRATSLDGVPAVEESFAYTFAGRANVQSDVLARRGAQVVVVELDGEPAAARSQEPAFEGLFRSWRWR